MAYNCQKGVWPDLSISGSALFGKVHTGVKMKRIILILMFLCFLAPSFAAEIIFDTLGEERIAYEKLISSKNTILFIWATWCPSCRRELEKISEARIFYEAIDFWYVDTGERASTVKSYVKEKKLTDNIRDRIILDKKGYIAQKFSVIGIPTYLFFKNGKQVLSSYYFDDQLLEKVFGKE